MLERLRSRPDSPRVLGQLRAGHGAYETPKQVCKPKPPCALLEADGSCGAYEARPSACRGEHSLDRAQCERGTHHPFVRQLLTLPYAIYGGLDLACFGMGLDTHGVDLERALLELWEVRQPWARWLAGARLFSSGSAALVRADYDLIQIQPWSQR